jgi:Protein of unknown function (DUF3800)
MTGPRARAKPRTPRKLRRNELPGSHPTAVAFLDESGSIANDRFFAVGCLKLAEPSVLLRQVQKLRDRQHRYHEIHFASVTSRSLPFYREVVDLVVASDAEFSCFVADRNAHDPLVRFGSPWRAYEKLACQLIIGSISPRELLTVVADNYSTPDSVVFEQDLRETVNRRLGRLAVVSACRLDSRATDALQLVDLLTSAVTHDFRRAVKLAKARNPKGKLVAHIREKYAVESFVGGCKKRSINVATYRSAGGRVRLGNKAVHHASASKSS